MKFSFASVLAGAAALVALSSGALQAQVTYYNATTLPANPQTGAEHFLQQITLASSPATYTLASFQLGVNYADISADAGVIVEFYTGLNTSNTATDVLAGATYITGVNGTLTAPAAAGNYTYTFTLNTPLVFPAGTGTLGVNFYFTDDSLANFSPGAINGRFSTVAPTAGTSLNYVWNDANLDGTFTGAEKTTFGGAGAYVRFSMTGTVTAVPEPRTYALCGLAFAGLAGVVLRRRSAQA